MCPNRLNPGRPFLRKESILGTTMTTSQFQGNFFRKSTASTMTWHNCSTREDSIRTDPTCVEREEREALLSTIRVLKRRSTSAEVYRTPYLLLSLWARRRSECTGIGSFHCSEANLLSELWTSTSYL